MQLDRDDALFERQCWLLQQLDALSSSSGNVQWRSLPLPAALAAARVLVLREVRRAAAQAHCMQACSSGHLKQPHALAAQAEVTQLWSLGDLRSSINPRNEAAALAMLLSHEHGALPGACATACQALRRSCQANVVCCCCWLQPCVAAAAIGSRRCRSCWQRTRMAPATRSSSQLLQLQLRQRRHVSCAPRTLQKASC